ncbi:hypothetical protein ABMY26_06515 (plasmid) [Azospirillum sp. HJ39]|uniref:hypothetical protein n=1 Tax=Azospirillum sp. HJ39 TaxID=3159496 RepID=UPI0035579F59
MLKHIALASVLLVAACSDPENARRTVENSGIAEVRAGGYSWFGCGKGDFYATSFTGIGPNGRPVSGVVCRGILKGATIRFD